MKNTLRSELHDRMETILDRIPAETFFSAAARCLHGSNSPTRRGRGSTWPPTRHTAVREGGGGGRPERRNVRQVGRSWTGNAETSGAMQEALHSALAARLPTPKFFGGDHTKVGHLLGAARIKKFQGNPALLLKQRVHTLGRATSPEDTSRTFVDLFLKDVVRNWVAAPGEKNARRREEPDTEIKNRPTDSPVGAFRTDDRADQAATTAPEADVVVVGGGTLDRNDSRTQAQYEDMLARRRRRKR